MSHRGMGLQQQPREINRNQVRGNLFAFLKHFLKLFFSSRDNQWPQSQLVAVPDVRQTQFPVLQSDH